MVESRIGRELSILYRNFPLRFDSFVSGRRGKPSDSSKESPVNIILYGFHENLDPIGQQLSTQHLYLQHPLGYDTSVKYDNPHYFLPPGEKLELPDLVCLEIATGSCKPKSQLLDEALKIFEAARLPEPQQCPELAVISGLKTTLKELVPHFTEVAYLANSSPAIRKLRLRSCQRRKRAHLKEMSSNACGKSYIRIQALMSIFTLLGRKHFSDIIQICYIL